MGCYDMSQLLLGGTILGSWMFARRYGSGAVGPTPKWETLLEPPVKVIQSMRSNYWFEFVRFAHRIAVPEPLNRVVIAFKTHLLSAFNDGFEGSILRLLRRLA